MLKAIMMLESDAMLARYFIQTFNLPYELVVKLIVFGSQYSARLYGLKLTRTQQLISLLCILLEHYDKQWISILLQRFLYKIGDNSNISTFNGIMLMNRQLLYTHTVKLLSYFNFQFGTKKPILPIDQCQICAYYSRPTTISVPF